MEEAFWPISFWEIMSKDNPQKVSNWISEEEQ